MSSDEEDDFEMDVASDEEGGIEDGIVIPINEYGDENDDDNDDDDDIERLQNLNWMTRPAERRGRRSKKDVLVSSATLLFEASDILSCFDNFMTVKAKELLIKYTNMMGEFFVHYFDTN